MRVDANTEASEFEAVAGRVRAEEGFRSCRACSQVDSTAATGFLSSYNRTRVYVCVLIMPKSWHACA
jgi:hypothetical protein